MQLILWCKHERDDGLVLAESYANLGTQLGFSRQTASRMLSKLDAAGYTESSKTDHDQLIIRLPMYNESQALTAKEASKRGRKWPGKASKLDGENQTTRPDHTRPDQTIPSLADKPPFEQLRNLYTEICQGFPEPTEVSDWSPKRRGSVNARWKAHRDLDWWRTYFEQVKASDFLRNGSDSWKADFGWIMLPSNMEKILEGRYDNKKKKQGQLTSEKDYGEPGEREF